MTTAAPTLQRPQARPGSGRPGDPPVFRGDDGGGPSGPSGGGGTAAPGSPATIGVWLLVGAIIILFAAFTSTLVVRRGENDWRPGPLPALLWLNTAVLMASSATLEWARAGARTGHLGRMRQGVGVTVLLGVAFLAGQWVAWRQLMVAGVSMAAGPHSAFFYLLTGSHGVHLAGGVAALAYAFWRVRRAALVVEASRVVAPTAIYWHFVDALWLYVFVLLFVI